MTTQFLEIDGKKLAYDKVDGEGRNEEVGIVFLHGLKSDRQGSKAQFLKAYCATHKIPFLAIDARGHGDSSGDFKEFTITHAVEDNLQALEHLTTGPQILIGSSMGGWVMLRLALELYNTQPEKIHGMIGIAAAPDFTVGLWDHLTDGQKEEVKTKGHTLLPSEYDEPYYISKNLLEDGAANFVKPHLEILTTPLYLLQGVMDTITPYEEALEIGKLVASPTCHIHLIKDGEHSLSRPQDLEQLQKAVETLRGDNN